MMTAIAVAMAMLWLQAAVLRRIRRAVQSGGRDVLTSRSVQVQVAGCYCPAIVTPPAVSGTGAHAALRA